MDWKTSCRFSFRTWYKEAVLYYHKDYLRLLKKDLIVKIHDDLKNDFSMFFYLYDGVKFKPIKIDIHQGIIKIVDTEIFYDFQLNNSESVIVGTKRWSFRENSKRVWISI